MPAETTFTLQTWNVWYGGREVDFGQEKQYAIAAQFPADVLALQECWGSAAENLAPKLLADHAQRGWDTAVLSTGQLTPVDTSTLPYAQAALVRPLPDSSRFLVWSVHLAPYPYAVYRALQGEGQEVADAEEAPRLQQIEEILSETARISAEVDEEDLPVVICGDFNTPSTGDWAARTDRPDIAWRSPDALLAAGFTDTFRAIHPDPVAAPADTWSPVEPLTRAGHEEKPNRAAPAPNLVIASISYSPVASTSSWRDSRLQCRAWSSRFVDERPLWASPAAAEPFPSIISSLRRGSPSAADRWERRSLHLRTPAEGNCLPFRVTGTSLRRALGRDSPH